MNLPERVWVLDTVICLSIQGGSITPVAGSLQVAVTRHCCTTGQFHSMFSWQIGSRPQVTGGKASKLSQRDMPLFISAHTGPGWAQDQQETMAPSLPVLPWLQLTPLSEQRKLCADCTLSAQTPTIFNWVKTDKNTISLILQKIFFSLGVGG